MEGWRRIIGFDGAFMKGVCRGELLSCISKDGKNQMYPVTWAVVNKEQWANKQEKFGNLGNS